MKKKPAVLAIAGVFVGLVVLRETGAVDVNLYKSELSNSQAATKSETNPGTDKHFNYFYNLKQKEKLLSVGLHSSADPHPLQIAATLEDPVYSGNWLMPFAKNFKMTYRCQYITVDSPNGHTVQGKIEGEVQAEIYGFCSQRKARALAFESAKKQIVDYLQKLNHHGIAMNQ
jgi:hypothetical protein